MFKLLPPPQIIEGPFNVQPIDPHDSDVVDCAIRLRASQIPDKRNVVHRPRMRFCAEVLCLHNGRRDYHRLPGSGIIVDAESAEQLQWLWLSFAHWLSSLDGKYLSGPPTTVPRGTLAPNAEPADTSSP